MTKIESNETVIVVMHSPREKVWGVLHEINSAGIYIRSIDLNAFEEYIGAIARGEEFIGFGDHFFPLWRLERLIRDEESGGVPSLKQQFEKRTGRKVSEQ